MRAVCARSGRGWYVSGVPSGSSKKRSAACFRKRRWAKRCTASSKCTRGRTTRTPHRNLPSWRSRNVAVQYYGTGRRKTSTARVFLRPGTGAISINYRTFETFFPTEALRTQIRQPLLLTETGDKFDVLATVAGGGVSGQAGALRLGISRALVEYNLELRKRLKDAGLLTRDARAKERKKYGMAGARKRFQFSKR